MGFPGGSDGKESAYSTGDLGQEDPLEKGMATQSSPVFLPRKSHGQRSLVGYSPWGLRESDTTELLTHSPSVWLQSPRS